MCTLTWAQRRRGPRGGRVRQLLRAHPRRGDLPRPVRGEGRARSARRTAPPGRFQFSTRWFLFFYCFFFFSFFMA